MNHGYKIGMYMNVPPFFFLISLFVIPTKSFYFSYKQKNNMTCMLLFAISYL